MIFPNPGYPPDEFWITYAGGTVVYAPLVEPDFHFDLDSLQSLITPKTKMLIINSPQRPNGMTVGQLDEIAAICAEHNVIVLTDEIFSHMVYSGGPSTGRSPPSRGWPTARSWSTPSRRPTS